MATALLITSAAVSAVTAIAGGVLSTVGQVAQYNQEKANAEMAQEQANRNARIEEQEAKRVENETQENIRRQQEESAYKKSSQRAMMGVSGASMESGSPLAVLGQTAADEQQKSIDIGYHGAYESAQHREQATQYRYQGAVAKAQAPTKTSLGLGIAGTWLNTTQSLAQTGLMYSAASGSGSGSGKGFLGSSTAKKGYTGMSRFSK